MAHDQALRGTDGIIEAKRLLRAQAKARRAALAGDLRNASAMQIAAIGIGFAGAKPPARVSAFLPIGEELNPVPLMNALRREGFSLALPVMVGKGKALVFRSWSPGEPLATAIWGIKEPEASAPEVLPDIVLMPLLAFDRQGHRLGYGGGFYDRTLKALRAAQPITTIGLAFAEQEVDAVPHLDYDERIDWVLTPDGPIHCRP
ncbi:MAG: 5-formyltetrahydrofolate cyclo-ligase [Hyphomicrobiaceae bacterium]